MKTIDWKKAEKAARDAWKKALKKADIWGARDEYEKEIKKARAAYDFLCWIEGVEGNFFTFEN